MSTRPNRRRAARGLTLIEIILVLAILAVMAAFAWPLLTRSFEAQRLRAASDLVRARLVRARVEAIDSGAQTQFRYTIDGRRFTISRDGCVNDATTLGGEPTVESSSRRSTDRLSGELPEGITFAAPQPNSPLAGDTPPPEDAAPLEDGETGWAEPVFFQPDGTTSTATVRLKNKNGRCLELTLRGMTGVVLVGDVFAEEGLR